MARTDYDRVKDHFATLREAADGAAKVVVTSRHQHFATDRDTRTALGGEARSLPGSRTMRLLPLDPGQRRRLVVDELDDAAEADRFLGRLGEVNDLLGLASNPRMLAFTIHWHREGLLDWTEEAARTGERITAGTLYERLLTTWLEHERARQAAAGGPRVLSVTERLDALTELALLLWADPERCVRAADLGEFADHVLDLPALRMRAGEAAHALGSSTVLVRRDDDGFAFIHQSVSEWLVARWAQKDLDGRLGERTLTPLMAEFLVDLAGAEAVVEWARQTASAVDDTRSAAKANAVLVLQRRGTTVDVVSYRDQDLQNRDLSALDLTGADLRGADLTGADLTGARLLGADLAGARLGGARLDRAALIGGTMPANAVAELGSSAGTALPDAAVRLYVAKQSPVRSTVAFPGGNLLVTGHADGSVRLGDPERGTWLRVLRGHRGAVRALAVDPAGAWLASAGDDGTVRIWDPVRGVLRATLLVSDDGWAALLADGSFKVHGNPASLWWAAGLCRFDAPDLPALARHRPELQPLPHDQVVLDG